MWNSAVGTVRTDDSADTVMGSSGLRVPRDATAPFSISTSKAVGRPLVLVNETITPGSFQNWPVESRRAQVKASSPAVLRTMRSPFPDRAHLAPDEGISRLPDVDPAPARLQPHPKTIGEGLCLVASQVRPADHGICDEAERRRHCRDPEGHHDRSPAQAQDGMRGGHLGEVEGEDLGVRGHCPGAPSGEAPHRSNRGGRCESVGLDDGSSPSRYRAGRRSRGRISPWARAGPRPGHRDPPRPWWPSWRRGSSSHPTAPPRRRGCRVRARPAGSIRPRWWCRRRSA